MQWEAVNSDLENRFEVLEEIQQGRFSAIYRCKDRKLDRTVVLKASSLAEAPPTEHARLIRELQVSCKLRHPAITSAFDGRRTKQYVLLILPWLERGSLSLQPEQERDAAYIQRAVLLTERLCEAVVYLHRIGIIHGDIKPDNILLDDAGQPYLTDFGSCQSTKAKEASGQVVGTAAYLAPEVVRGDEKLSIHSDLYAIGATLFAILAGEPPFTGDDAAVLQAVRTEAFPRLRRQSDSVPAAQEAIVDKACAPYAEQRYATAEVLLADLKAFRENRPITAQPSSVLREVQLWARRHPLMARLVLALATILLVGISASVTGWWNAQTTLVALQQSQADLAERGEQAQQREQQLQQTLASIQNDQASLTRSLEEEAALKTEAAEARQRSQQQTELAAQRLQEAQRLATTLQAEQQKVDAVSQDLQTAEMRAQKLNAFAAFKTQRIAANKRLRAAFATVTLAIRDVRPLPDRWERLLDLPREHAGNLPTILRYQSQVIKNIEENQGFGKPADVVVPEPLADELKGYTRDAVLLQFDPFDRQSIMWSHPDGLTRLRISAADSAAEWEREPNETINKIVSSFGLKSQNAIRIFPQFTFVLRQNKTTGDLEAFAVSNQDLHVYKQLWSCHAARSEALKDPAHPVADKPALTSKFLTVGTQPRHHIVFLSSVANPDQEVSRTCLHSLDLRGLESGSGELQEKTFDLGLQDPVTWPESLQLSKYLMLGIGAGVDLSDRNTAHQFHQQSASPWIRFPDGEWQVLGTEPQEETLATTEALLARYEPQIKQQRRNRKWSKPYFGFAPGRIVELVRSTKRGEGLSLFVYDCITGETLSDSPDVDAWRGEIAPSPSRAHWLRRDYGRLSVTTIAEPDESLFQSIDEFESYLPSLQARTYQAPSSPAGTVTLAKRKAVRIDGPASAFVVNPFKPEQDERWTIDLVCRVDPVPAEGGKYFSLLSCRVLGMQVTPSGDLEVTRHKRGKDGKPHWFGFGSSEDLTGRWVQFTAAWDGKQNKLYHFIDGKRTAVRQSDESLPNLAEKNKMDIGTSGVTIDALRVQRGVCPTESFQVVSPLRATDETVCLYHFNEGKGNRANNAASRKYTAHASRPKWVTSK